MSLTLIVVLVVALALFFDFTNGFHDTANAMATPIATGALRPRPAVALAAALNLVGAFLSTEVAQTISGGLIRGEGGQVSITPALVLAGLVGAITWNLITWLWGIPSSSSHALFGGLIGATIVGTWDVGSIDYSVLLAKIVIPALLSPVVAGLVAYSATRLAYAITHRGDGLADGRSGFRYAQIFSSSLVALSHGTNDAQKTMGVITLLLIAAGIQPASHAGPQWWVIVACGLAIATGTYTGGWRIIRTLGRGLTEVKPAQGFAAETSTAATILASSHFGFALSTTQVASGSVIGSGLGRSDGHVRWGTAGRIALGWLLTLPVAAVVGGATAMIARLGTIGLIIDLAIAVVVIVVVFRINARRRVTAEHMAAGTEAEVASATSAIHITRPVPVAPGEEKR
ncbi:inorganic phosphate transporter [Gryllotalpicola protaetiae]|uniref:Phosphate transporter n=1 Tax=Gryllotalpicola protaetiae TaxID=2419771 RepID=A0A387BLZ3_9MICO|nr:inorganic phosphate transporter [Gryllotalpicola protaetiae]AYG03392.1 anion permease [Gryllotalpicola protaetiae]